jgi:hypothetical protein
MSLYDTHEAETLRRNWYIALSGEADNSGRNWYAFLTARRNSYVPINVSIEFGTPLLNGPVYISFSFTREVSNLRPQAILWALCQRTQLLDIKRMLNLCFVTCLLLLIYGRLKTTNGKNSLHKRRYTFLSDVQIFCGSCLRTSQCRTCNSFCYLTELSVSSINLCTPIMWNSKRLMNNDLDGIDKK